MTYPNVYLGTSGFAFDDWRGPVYPEYLPRPQWLTYYEHALGFNALEVNYTYYQMPSPRTMHSLLRKTTDWFRFTIKTHRSMTHEVIQADGSIHDNPAAFEQFREGLRPLADSGKLRCVLAQFPYAFTNTPKARSYLETVIDRLADLALVIEFRHKSWVAPQMLALLRRRGVGLCAVDEPALPQLIPWVEEPTSELGYVRFHGRNAQAWFGTSTAQRYHYSYSDGQLRELGSRLDVLRGKVKTLMVFFNNCHGGAAAKNARQFTSILHAAGWPSASPSAAAVPSELFSVP